MRFHPPDRPTLSADKRPMPQVVRPPTPDNLLSWQGLIGNAAVTGIIHGRHNQGPSLQRQSTGVVKADPREPYLYDEVLNHSFDIRGIENLRLQLQAGQRTLYVTATPEPAVAVLYFVQETDSEIKFTARDDGRELACFRVEECADAKGGSLWLTHMWTEPPFQQRGLGKDLMRRCVAKFRFFRVGTEPNLKFFRPERANDIGLTEDGDRLIESMLAASVLDLSNVFPMQYKVEFTALLAAQNDSSDDSDRAGEEPDAQ